MPSSMAARPKLGPGQCAESRRRAMACYCGYSVRIEIKSVMRMPKRTARAWPAGVRLGQPEAQGGHRPK